MSDNPKPRQGVTSTLKQQALDEALGERPIEQAPTPPAANYDYAALNPVSSQTQVIPPAEPTLKSDEDYTTIPRDEASFIAEAISGYELILTRAALTAKDQIDHPPGLNPDTGAARARYEAALRGIANCRELLSREGLTFGRED